DRIPRGLRKTPRGSACPLVLRETSATPRVDRSRFHDRPSAVSATATRQTKPVCSWSEPYTLIGATSIQRRSRQLCSAHSANCTPLAPSSSVYLYGASSQTWRINISHCSLKPLS